MHRPSSHPSSRRVAATTTRSTALSIVALVLVASSTHLPRADAALNYQTTLDCCELCLVGRI